MASNKDYYQTLGLDRNATPDQIKQAYRNLARAHHPDMVKDGDKATAEKKFKEINEAYQILSDPEKRKVYDQYGSAAFNGNAAGNAGAGQGFGGQWGPFNYTYSTNGQNFDFGDFDPMDVFEQFFGFRGYGGANRPRKGKNLYYEMPITFKDALFGLEKEVKTETGPITVKIPAGVHEGTELRFTGKGLPGTQNAPNGDLYISIRLQKPKEFEIAGENLFIQKEISFIQAILGDVVEIPVIDLNAADGLGIAKLKIPEGTQFGTKLLIKGKGMPKLHGRGQGDVIVQTFFQMPKKLSRQQKELLERYKDAK